MFRFIELAIHNWDLWQPVRIKLDRDIVVITGPNGSGKTTLLDAVRQLLNAPRLSSKRRLQHYLRHPDAPVLIQAVVSNEEGNGTGRPFRRERITTPEATLCCMLVPNPGGSPEKRFAILPGSPTCMWLYFLAASVTAHKMTLCAEAWTWSSPPRGVCSTICVRATADSIRSSLSY